MKVLVVYHKDKPNIAKVFEGAEIIYAEIMDEKKPEGVYDVVYCDCLESLSPKHIRGMVQNLYSLVALKGELWLITQSFEFASQQAYAEVPHPALNWILYGTPENPHQSCFTLPWLRDLMESTGMILRQAHEEMQLVRNGDKEDKIPSNFVVGWKYEVPNPAEAIQ